ncbi:GLPGLI family protein [Polaribacter sp. KT 15]|uniref:GLPGLI family protein n=1 Tax=Polaribacter sp. KT 15 TaxID=1896175 RepID=UPI00090C4FC6|nr:GLPGLI family protein [Polaribacter sp. KT 15]SHM91179.1 GLPGLI family protein [Polaribacter sp. KT 15]
MKPIFTILLFFISGTLFSQNNSGIVKYEVTLNFTLEDIVAEEKKQKKELKTMRKIISESKKSEVVLKFEATQAISSVSKRMKVNEEKNGTDFVYSRAGRDKKFVTNIIVKSNHMQECKVLEKCYLIQQPKLDWKLTQETKIIGGYLCYKAINISSNNKKKKPIAWYTPNISASFGPKQYFGLPGLILELEEAAVIFKAKEITLNPKNKIVFEIIDGIKITKEAYNKKVKASYSGFYKKIRF